MATVIPGDAIESHNVNKYNFKVIGYGAQAEEIKEEPTVSVEPQLADEKVDSTALSDTTKDSLIESLMKKTDEMSSNFIKLQMKLESKEEEFSAELKKVKEAAYQEGLEAGAKSTHEALDQSIQSVKELYSGSIKKLEESAVDFNTSIESLKNELVLAALDIAKEVIHVEVSENSSAIAEVLSEELIKDLQAASKITLKVNPKDHSVISQKLGTLEHITVLSDNAINEGGVVVLSDAGNVDAQIQKRFERVKKAALSE